MRPLSQVALSQPHTVLTVSGYSLVHAFERKRIDLLPRAMDQKTLDLLSTQVVNKDSCAFAHGEHCILIYVGVRRENALSKSRYHRTRECEVLR